MQYLITEEERQKLINQGVREGRQKTENLMRDILNGKRDVRISASRCDETGMLPQEHVSNYPNNVWARLIKILDGKGGENE